jgi:hypothetical protein
MAPRASACAPRLSTAPCVYTLSPSPSCRFVFINKIHTKICSIFIFGSSK